MIGVTLTCAWLGMLAAPGDRLRGYNYINYIVRVISEWQPPGLVRLVTPGSLESRGLSDQLSGRDA